MVLVEASVKTSRFLEELFNSTMNALHLVGNPAFCRVLDIHSDSVVRVWRYHFVPVLSVTTGTEKRLRPQRLIIGPDRRVEGCQFPAFDLYSIRFPACLYVKIKLQSYGEYCFLGWMDNNCACHPGVPALTGIIAPQQAGRALNRKICGDLSIQFICGYLECEVVRNHYRIVATAGYQRV